MSKEIAEIKVCHHPTLEALEDQINVCLANGLIFHGALMKFGDGPYIQIMARNRETFSVPQRRKVNV